MAGVSVASGGRGGRRALDMELNMVPMIDLMMVTIAFLLLNAVWTQMGRLDASARAPGGAEPAAPAIDKSLHVDMKSPDRFVLTWRQGKDVVDTIDVPRRPVRDGASPVLRFPDLSAKLGETWRASGMHRDPADPARDRLVLHSDDATSYADLVAVMDAVHGVARPAAAGARRGDRSPAFVLTFAVD